MDSINPKHASPYSVFFHIAITFRTNHIFPSPFLLFFFKYYSRKKIYTQYISPPCHHSALFRPVNPVPFLLSYRANTLDFYINGILFILYSHFYIILKIKEVFYAFSTRGRQLFVGLSPLFIYQERHIVSICSLINEAGRKLSASPLFS